MQGPESVGCLEGSGHLDSYVKHFLHAQRAGVMNPGVQRVPGVILHHDVGPARRRGADLKDVDNIRVPGQLAHRALLAQESLEVVRIEVGGEHLDGHGALQGVLPAAVDRAETTASDHVSVIEPRRGQLRGDRGAQVILSRRRTEFGDEPPRPKGGNRTCMSITPRSTHRAYRHRSRTPRPNLDGPERRVGRDDAHPCAAASPIGA